MTFSFLGARPSAETVTSYSPGASFAKLYVPAASVCASIDWLVAKFLTETFALATAPDESVTLPDSVASLSCARRQGASKETTVRTAALPASLAVLTRIRSEEHTSELQS